MDRSLEKRLKEWENYRKTLSLASARGKASRKTYIIEKLGKTFESFVSVNFEAQPQAIACFDSLDPRYSASFASDFKTIGLSWKNASFPRSKFRLVQRRSSHCAISKRSFRAACHRSGIFTGIRSGRKKFSFPVGRIQFMYLKPLSFSRVCPSSRKIKGFRQIAKDDS